MTTIDVAGQKFDLPCMILGREQTKDKTGKAWLHNDWVTVKLTASVSGFRAHTNGKAFAKTASHPERIASAAEGAWAAIGDSILTSSEVVDQSALPGPFTHVSEVVIPVN